jgi:hypothetical protein
MSEARWLQRSSPATTSPTAVHATGATSRGSTTAQNGLPAMWVPLWVTDTSYAPDLTACTPTNTSDAPPRSTIHSHIYSIRYFNHPVTNY